MTACSFLKRPSRVKAVVKRDWKVFLGGLNKITLPLESVQEKKRHLK